MENMNANEREENQNTNMSKLIIVVEIEKLFFFSSILTIIFSAKREISEAKPNQSINICTELKTMRT